MAGEVYVNGQKPTKAGMDVPLEAEVEVRGNVCPYVSRGGLKLEKALRDFGVDPTGYVCSDSGASTGGFTDCLLQQGASKVFAIDVGYGQLAWKIRSDPRVVVMERTNIRYVTPGGSRRSARPLGGRCIVHLAEDRVAGHSKASEADGAGAVPDQAAV